MRSCIVLGVLIVSQALHAVEITATDDGFSVRTPVYSAAVNSQMALTSLRVGDTEFLAPVVLRTGETDQALGALWCTPFNQWQQPAPMPSAPTRNGDTLRAKGHGGSWPTASPMMTS